MSHAPYAWIVSPGWWIQADAKGVSIGHLPDTSPVDAGYAQAALPLSDKGRRPTARRCPRLPIGRAPGSRDAAQALWAAAEPLPLHLTGEVRWNNRPSRNAAVHKKLLACCICEAHYSSSRCTMCPAFLDVSSLNLAEPKAPPFLCLTFTIGSSVMIGIVIAKAKVTARQVVLISPQHPAHQ